MVYIDNVFSTPYYVFIQCEAHEEKAIMSKLGLGNWQLVADESLEQAVDCMAPRLFTTWQNGWLHIMDNWQYNLWYNQTFRKALLPLSNAYDVFLCCIGDADDYHEFSLLLQGKEFRKYAASHAAEELDEAPVMTNIGPPLPSEKAEFALKQTNEDDDLVLQRMIAVANGLGITTNHRQANIAVYGPGKAVKNDFTFDELKLAPHEENYEICKWFIPFSIKKRIKNRKASETANLILKVVNSW